MRGLLVLVVTMGVLIVAGVAVLGAVIVRRGFGPAATAADVALHEPAGTRIAGASAGADRLTLRLQGGGPDRVLVLDPASGRVLARVALSP